MLFDPGACCACTTGSAVLGVYVQCSFQNAVLLATAPATGAAGVTVGLYSDSGRTALVASAVTDSTGRVSFTGLAAGTYYLQLGGSGWSTYNPAGSFVLTSTSNVGGQYTLNTDSSHGCRPCCSLGPILPATLSCTTGWGPCTLTLNSGKSAYTGTVAGVAYSTAGTLASGCPGVVDVLITLNIFGCTLGFSIPWGTKVDLVDGYSCCPGAPGVGAGNSGFTGISASPTPDCGPGFSLSVGGSGSISSLSLTGCGATALRIFYDSTNTYDYSITVTE